MSELESKVAESSEDATAPPAEGGEGAARADPTPETISAAEALKMEGNALLAGESVFVCALVAELNRIVVDHAHRLAFGAHHAAFRCWCCRSFSCCGAGIAFGGARIMDCLRLFVAEMESQRFAVHFLSRSLRLALQSWVFVFRRTTACPLVFRKNSLARTFQTTIL